MPTLLEITQAMTAACERVNTAALAASDARSEYDAANTANQLAAQELVDAREELEGVLVQLAELV